jgi:hypothetical protein
MEHSAVTISHPNRSPSLLGKILSVYVIRGSKNGKKSLPNVRAPNKTRGQPHQKTAKSVDAVVAISLKITLHTEIPSTS